MTRKECGKDPRFPGTLSSNMPGGFLHQKSSYHPAIDSSCSVSTARTVADESREVGKVERIPSLYYRDILPEL